MKSDHRKSRLEEGQNTKTEMVNFMEKFYRNKFVENRSAHIFWFIHFFVGAIGTDIWSISDEGGETRGHSAILFVLLWGTSIVPGVSF